MITVSSPCCGEVSWIVKTKSLNTFKTITLFGGIGGFDESF